ncbi:MAG: M56 family metallopeptidase [Candidatus Sulfotelmatobacter sp.]
MIAWGIQLEAQLLAERALNSFFGGLLIAAIAWLILRVVGRQNSGTRFAVWFLALIAIAGLPFVPGLNTTGAVTQAMHAEVTLPGSWAVAIFAVWIFFVALAATRVVVGLWNLRRLRRSGVPLITSELDPVLRETLAQCHAIRPVTVCSSPVVSVPTAIGFFKPVILIPEWALRDLPGEELKIILLHEFAHLRRRDDWTNLVQKIVRTVFFFHPAVWWIEKRLSLEREMACDDAVLAETRNPRAYAECLVSLAEKSFVQRSLAMAQAAIGHACETSIRLARILDDVGRPRATRVFKPALVLMTAFAGVCLVILPDAPRLIAFENTVQPHSLASTAETLQRGTVARVVPVTARTSAYSPNEIEAPKVTPVSAIYRPSELTRMKPSRDSSARVKSARLNVPRMVAGQGRDRRPVAVVATAKSSTPAPPVFLVVMQTTEFDDRGFVVLSLSMWRVTFELPHGNAVQQGVFAKSI